MEPVRVGILTISDRCSSGAAEDKSGDGLEDFINTKWGCGVVELRDCVADDVTSIQKRLIEWSDVHKVDLILTTGGTGFAPRDVTPEATVVILDKDAPGLVVAMIQGSLLSTKMAMLSRPVCGVRKRTLIINLPGSSKGSMENLLIIEGQIKHAIDLLRDAKSNVESQHAIIQQQKQKTLVNAINVADRDRKSPFESLKVEVAQNLVVQMCSAACSANNTELRTLRNGLGYIIAEDVFAKDPLPPFPASIKDGYAVVCESSMDLLQVRGDSTAGESPEKCLVEKGYCIRVSTGAPIPPGADAVVMIEDTELVERTEDGNDEKLIRILKKPSVGQDIRAIGSDIEAGQKVLEKGMKLGASELGILATVGVTKFHVFRKPIVALLSTGNELQSPNEEKLIKGKIRDSNKTTLEALMAKESFETKDIGIAKDTPQDVLHKLLEAFETCDILVCTGGVSMGEKDYMKRVLKTDCNAEIHFGSVLMKPGKPTTFATCLYKGRQKFIFGLPGNPVSATVTSYLFVIPACRALSGWNAPFYTSIKVSTERDMKLDPARPEYHRVTLSWETDSGIPTAHSTGNQISSRLLSCNAANALLLLPQGSGMAPAGSILTAIIIST